MLKVGHRLTPREMEMLLETRQLIAEADRRLDIECGWGEDPELAVASGIASENVKQACLAVSFACQNLCQLLTDYDEILLHGWQLARQDPALRKFASDEDGLRLARRVLAKRAAGEIEG